MMTTGKRWMNPLTLVLVLSGAFFAIFLIISGLFFLTKGPSGASRMAGRTSFFRSTGNIALIEINGVIMDSEKTLAKLERAEEDDQIKAVVLRLNSPGGATAPSQEIYEAVKRFDKPVVVSMASVAASGAYYIAVGAKKVFANPGTLTGSIGVIMEFANLEKLYDWAKVKRFSIKSGKFKNMGAEYKEMTPEEHEILQSTVDDVLIQFKKAVAQGRSLSDAQVTAVADGRIFTGRQAKALHLVDELGGLHEAVEEAARLGKVEGKPRVVRMKKEKMNLLEYFMDDNWGEDNSESRMENLRFLGQMQRAFEKIVEPGSHPSSQGLSPGFYWIWNGAAPGALYGN